MRSRVVSGELTPRRGMAADDLSDVCVHRKHEGSIHCVHAYAIDVIGITTEMISIEQGAQIDVNAIQLGTNPRRKRHHAEHHSSDRHDTRTLEPQAEQRQCREIRLSIDCDV